jgi:hypothetical protein
MTHNAVGLSKGDCIELVAKRGDVRFLPIAGLPLHVRQDFLVDERDRLFFCRSLSLRSRTDSSWRRMTLPARTLVKAYSARF